MTKNEILKLKQANHQHFDNALHVQFHHTQYELVAAVGEEKLHLPAGLLEAWKKNIELETEINKQSMLSVHTQALTAKDKERDALLSHFFGMIRAQMISPVQSMSQAAQKVFAALKPYFNIQGDGAAAESAHIRGMEVDAQKLAAELATLGLAAVLAQIHTANQAYEKLAAERSSDAAAAQLPTAKDVRQKTDEQFDSVCQYIQASYLLAATDADRKPAAELITLMNRATAELKTRHNESAAQRKTANTNKKAKQLEKDHQLVDPLIPAFEQQEGLAPGSLKFTGNATGSGSSRTYELTLAGAEKPIFVRVKKDHLVLVIKVKPKKKKK